MSRSEILAAVQKNKPSTVGLPEPFTPFKSGEADLKEAFSLMVNQIGGQVLSIQSEADIQAYVSQHYKPAERVVTSIESLHDTFSLVDANADPHSLADVSLAILPGQFGVAENAAIWLSDVQLRLRILPFICQHLAIVLWEEDLVANMHEAYDRIGEASNAFGLFIAGPSKTADIEQSLVVGAHGARSLLVFLLK